ncbi:hypothetical protein ACM66B_004071 [Microbotryomycetes sp. NB124-2]
MQLDLLSPPPRFSPLPHNLPPPESSSDEPSAADDTNKAPTGKARAAGRDEAEPEAVQHTPLMEPPEQATPTMAVDDILFDALPELNKDNAWHETAKAPHQAWQQACPRPAR